MAIELRVVQFWSEIILVISNQTRAARSFDFEITRMISDQIALHSVQLPLLIFLMVMIFIFDGVTVQTAIRSRQTVEKIIQDHKTVNRIQNSQ